MLVGALDTLLYDFDNNKWKPGKCQLIETLGIDDVEVNVLKYLV